MPISKKIQAKTGEKLEKFDPTFLMKFLIVKEVLMDIFNFNYTIKSFFEPKQIEQREIYGYFIDFFEKLQDLEGQTQTDINKIHNLEKGILDIQNQIDENTWQKQEIFEQKENEKKTQEDLMGKCDEKLEQI